MAIIALYATWRKPSQNQLSVLYRPQYRPCTRMYTVPDIPSTRGRQFIHAHASVRAPLVHPPASHLLLSQTEPLFNMYVLHLTDTALPPQM